MNGGTLATWEKYASNARVIWNIVYVATVFLYLKLELNSYAKTVIQLFLYVNYNKPEKKSFVGGLFLRKFDMVEWFCGHYNAV